MERLAQEGHEIHLMSRNRGGREEPWLVNHFKDGGLFDKIPSLPPVAVSRTCPKYQTFKRFIDDRCDRLPTFDAWVIWLGQNGSSLHPVPSVAMPGAFTSPYVSLVSYGYPIVAAINAAQAQPTWLCPDPRNTIKFRDLWTPLDKPVLGQYDCTKRDTFYDERSGILAEKTTQYNYAGIEMLAVAPKEHQDFTTCPPISLGIVVNEGRTDCKNRRRDLIKEWMPEDVSTWEIFGTWTKEGAAFIRKPDVYPVSVADVDTVLRRWRSTITLPAQGTGWATAKPWECFRSGCICFKHPAYDDQMHVYGHHMPEELYGFLCVHSPETFWARVNSMTTAEYQHYAALQFKYYRDSVARLDGGALNVLKAVTTC